MSEANTGLPANTAVLKNVRVAYPNLVVPAPDLNGIDKYSCVLLIPKNHTCIDGIKLALKAAIETGKQKKWNGIVPNDLHVCLQDGDTYAAAAPEKPRDHYKGHYYINAKQDPEWGKPTVIDQYGIESQDTRTINSGDQVSAVVEFFPYKQAAGNGISATPKVVYKVSEGEPIGGGVSKNAALAALGIDPATLAQPAAKEEEEKPAAGDSDPLAGIL